MFPNASETQVTVDDEEIQFIRETGMFAKLISSHSLFIITNKHVHHNSLETIYSITVAKEPQMFKRFIS